MKYVRLALLVTLGLALIFPWTTRAQEKKTYTFAVIPQTQISDIYENWVPFLKRLSRETGVEITLKPYNTIQQFESDLSKGVPDFAYMNPYEAAVSAKDKLGYVPLIRDTSNLVGILVVHKGKGINSPKDLNGKEIAFPSHAFAASEYMRALLSEKEKIHFKSNYVKTHSSVYRAVIMDSAAAGGGAMKTLMKEPEEIKNQLSVIYETPSTASHPISANHRVPETVRRSVVKAILDFANDKTNKEMLQKIQIPQPVAADYQKDYLPLKKLGGMLEKYQDPD